MKLYCKGHYYNGPRSLLFEEGVIDVLPEIAAFLLRDAPDHFTRDLPEAKALDGPVLDKAIKAPARKKTSRRSKSGGQ